MNKFLALILALGVFIASPQHAYGQTTGSKAQIEKVVENFRTAIVNKDEDGFLKLFLKEDITWTGVMTDASIARLYANRPNPAMKPPRKTMNMSPRKFINMIAADKAEIDETISNVRIDSDGDVAQVWFDYSFLNGDYKENWGKESWQMVRTEDGWKIAAVVWSQEMNPTPPPK
ncbi:MAG TPA: nuclear transport factor 2 family protein [Telluria sp.]